MFGTPKKGKKGDKSGAKGRRKALTPDKAKALFKKLVTTETPKKAIPIGLKFQMKMQSKKQLH